MCIQNGKVQYKLSTFILICEVSGTPCFYRQTGSGSHYYDWHNEKHDVYYPTVFINPSILCTYVILKNCLPPAIQVFCLFVFLKEYLVNSLVDFRFNRQPFPKKIKTPLVVHDNKRSLKSLCSTSGPKEHCPCPSDRSEPIAPDQTIERRNVLCKTVLRFTLTPIVKQSCFIFTQFVFTYGKERPCKMCANY